MVYVVDRFQLGQFFEVAFDEIGEPSQHPAALRWADFGPAPFVESAARGGDGEIDIRLVTFGDVRDNRPGGGIVNREGLAGSCRNSLPSISIKGVRPRYPAACRSLGSSSIVSMPISSHRNRCDPEVGKRRAGACHRPRAAPISLYTITYSVVAPYAIGPDHSLLVADDVGNVIWRVTAARPR